MIALFLSSALNGVFEDAVPRMKLLRSKEDEQSQYQLYIVSIEASEYCTGPRHYLDTQANPNPHHHTIYPASFVRATDDPLDTALLLESNLLIAQVAHAGVLSLPAGNVQELTVGGVKHSYPIRKVNAHDPKFDITRKIRSHDINNHGHESVHMKRRDGCEHQWESSNL
jgi:hypothetical protein